MAPTLKQQMPMYGNLINDSSNDDHNIWFNAFELNDSRPVDPVPGNNAQTGNGFDPAASNREQKGSIFSWCCLFLNRILLGICLILLLICIGVGIYFIVAATSKIDEEEVPDIWYITRPEWGAISYPATAIDYQFQPTKMVVIQHSMTEECHDTEACGDLLRSIQQRYISLYEEDIPYNFIVGTDGLLYEGRGWGKVSDRSVRFNACTLSIGFIGNYNNINVTSDQIANAKRILDTGLSLGYLDEDYTVVGAKNIRDTDSPGAYLYDAIQQWGRYDHDNRYRDMTCEMMHEVHEGDDMYPWYIPRDQWGSSISAYEQVSPSHFPARLVVINHSVTRVCHSFDACVLELRALQDWLLPADIPYHFAIGNDGRVYEVRGWGALSGGNRLQQPCEVNIGFIGDYSLNSEYDTNVTPSQVTNTLRLLSEGVSNGYLAANFSLVGARDISATTSPGERLYEEIASWDVYDNRYDGMSCDQIHKE